MNNNKISIEIVDGTQKKDATKKWKALKITIGEWNSGLIFPNPENQIVRSNFELDYIEKVIQSQKQ